MLALRLPRFAVLAVALVLTAPATAQQSASASAELVTDLRDVDVQKQLIALGVLDATVGRASRRDLREAVAWFRKAYQSSEGSNPLTAGEREKLKEAYDKFIARTGLVTIPYPDPKTGTELKLRVPVAFVGKTPQKSIGSGMEWHEFRESENKLSVGPEIHRLADFTPIALFRDRIMKASLIYKHLHLTSDEFTAEGNAGDEIEGYFSSNMVLTAKDKLKGVFMRSAKRPPDSFEVPDFLVPIVASEPGGPKGDPRTRGWQLLMQGVANLIVSEFPFDNGWQAVSTRPCPLTTDDAAAGPKGIRVLFGTDRKAKPGGLRKGGAVADADSLFANEPGNQLHLGCAYVTVPPVLKEGEEKRDLAKSTINDYQWLFSTEKGDIGDQLYLSDELALQAQPITRAARRRDGKRLGREGVSALVFIHGYNVAFKDALFTVSQIVASTEYPGRVYMYSWPSAVSTFGYVADLDNAEQGEPFLQSFMRLLMRDADIDEIDILVHSMGSQSVLRALSALRSVFETERRGEYRPKAIRIGQLMFAAPDVSMPVFEQKIRRIAPYADRVTVYASSTDAALLASKVLRSGASRMGELNSDGQPLLVEVKNVHVIDATGPERWWRLDRIWTGQGHDYFRQSPGILKDIQQILKSLGDDDSKTPSERSSTRFEQVPFKENKDWSFWRLKEK
jgi:esterase/lipase superfamily enzyme